MAISYDEAVSMVRNVGQSKKCEPRGEECVQLISALGRRASQDVRSTLNTPIFDSSAMDGYAVSSTLTANASPDEILCLRVEGTIAAGDSPLLLPCDVDEQGRIACVEIMTGAPFPQSSLGPEFDACVPWEQVHAAPLTGRELRTVTLQKPPKPNQHRRFAGHDFSKNDIVLRKGDEIGPHHIMALASVGIDAVCVQKRIQATVVTTGSELREPRSLSLEVTKSNVSDCNGPYLCSSLQSIGIQVDLIKGISDNIDELRHHFSKAIASRHCDIVITTGGVSAGKFDFVPEVIAQLGGSVHFHHVAMRPGHPVLFASLPTSANNNSKRDVAFIGLPGNPVAAAVCYRFLVVPYLLALLGQEREMPMCNMRIAKDTQDIRDDDIVCRKDKKLDLFRHARYCGDKVVMSSEQSPGKVRPFVYSNCWVHIEAGVSEVKTGDKVDCYP